MAIMIVVQMMTIDNDIEFYIWGFMFQMPPMIMLQMVVVVARLRQK